jgi:hypothetical protein
MLKTEIQERVSEAREKLIKALEGLGEEQASRVGLTSEWSIKDALAHINAWEIEGARIVSEIQNGTWQPRRLDKQQIDDFNARVVEERRARSLGELREEFDAAHTRIEAVVASMPDKVDEKSPAYKYIEGVTLHHLPHHAELISKYRDK